MAFGGLGNLFGNKKQEAAVTDAARQQAQEAISKTKSDLNVRFAHLEELVAATLTELKTWRPPSTQHQEKKQ